MTLRSALDRELETLRDDVLRMGSLVEEAISLALQALRKNDARLAQQVIDDDEKVNTMRFELEEFAIRIIALQAPNTSDLRFVTAALNIVVDLERMADHAAGICKVVVRLPQGPPPENLLMLPRMGVLVLELLHEALDAYINVNTDAAQKIAARDDEIDDLYQHMFFDVIALMNEDPALVEHYTYMLWMGHSLERMGDRVTNICERVVFVKTGEMEELNIKSESRRL
jgi:phosphate transport system protein